MPPKNFQKIKLDIKKYGDLFNDFSLIAGEEAVKLFQENFTEQGWQGATFEPWKRKTVADGYNTLMSKNQNSLQQSIHVAYRTEKQVVIATGDKKPYARIHNEGGTIHIPVTDKVRKWGWAMFYETGNKMYKGIALTKKSTLKVVMPKRQFMGNTPELQKRIETTFIDYLKRLSKS